MLAVSKNEHLDKFGQPFYQQQWGLHIDLGGL
jgi:hypothetical protein